MIIIPLSSAPDFTFTTILDTVAYDFRLHWNDRDESWYIYLGLANQPYRFKTKITNGTDILSKYRAYDDIPKGVLIVLDKEKVYGRLQRDSFSSGRFSLIYFSETEASLLRERNLIR